jgi:hypothetical protein
MLSRPRAVAAVLVLGGFIVATSASAQIQGYRWVDEQGTVHYASRRDQVPERYRAQLHSPRPGEVTPQLAPNVIGDVGTPHGCILRLRGTEKRRGTSHSYPNCDECRKALGTLKGDALSRAECFASSIEDELGKGSR